ncbi:MAG: glutamate racemase [Nitritalea sp.]
MKRNSFPLLFFVLLGAGLLTSACQPAAQKETEASATGASWSPLERAMLLEPESPFYLDTKSYRLDPRQAIGVFDSGTGGLTILDTILEFDGFQNADGSPGADGLPDFEREAFIYLADQANMPYGNYASEGKSELLLEHILKDAHFLLGNRYVDERGQLKTDKPAIKALVVACNTATAYGKEALMTFMERAQLPVHVIGVIDAGVRGALALLNPEEDASVGVFATVGTVKSKGYANTLHAQWQELGAKGTLQVFNQGGLGVAEAVDGESEYIAPGAQSIRSNYRGPAFEHSEHPIERALWEVYNFNFEAGGMLCDSPDTDDCQILQLNSTENYVRYHLVSLLEQMRQSPDAAPLRVLLLGCTHYPYLKKEIRQVLGELYAFREGETYRYRHLMAAEIALVDPAENVAEELYAFLHGEQLLHPESAASETAFYISIPNTTLPEVQVDAAGRFPYAYKYGREAGENKAFVQYTPFSPEHISADTYERLAESTPTTAAFIQKFQERRSDFLQAQP